MKKIAKSILIAIIALSASVALFAGEAKAYTMVDVPVVVVEDLGDAPFPDTVDIKYDSEKLNISKFSIDTAGQLKAVILCQVGSRTSGNIWVSTDYFGKKVIGNVTKFSGETTEVSWFLEKGDYYLHSKCDNYPYETSIALLFEKARVDETNKSTSFSNGNFLAQDSVAINYLTFENPNEYFYFQLDEKATVTINYSFDADANEKTDTGYCSLYDKYGILLKEGTYSTSDKGLKSISYLLEPGVYYIKLSGMKGNTVISYSSMFYNIKLSAETDGKWTKEAIKVNIDTSIDYSRIAVLCSDVKESLINNDELWSPANKNYVALDGESFMAEKSGVYSVRITDKNGYNTMAKISITNIDVTKPTVSGVKNNKAYNKAITIKFDDEDSGINAKKTTLNGKAVKSGVKVDKEGNYTLKVYDNVGNYRTYNFSIDFTAPTAGVENGKTYKESLTLKFKDNLTGIKKIVLDGSEVTSSSPMYLYANGEYELELWDNADNYRKIVFYIKK